MKKKEQWPLIWVSR